eukprot:4931821-Amphidinium_carterae.1
MATTTLSEVVTTYHWQFCYEPKPGRSPTRQTAFANERGEQCTRDVTRLTTTVAAAVGCSKPRTAAESADIVEDTCTENHTPNISGRR